MRNIVWKRVLPILMAMVMLCSACLSVGALGISAPTEEEPIWSVTMEQGVLRIRLNAERLYAVLEDKQLTKEELRLLLPETVMEAFESGELSAKTVLSLLTDYLSTEELTELLAMLPAELFWAYFPFEALEGVLSVDELLAIAKPSEILAHATAEELRTVLTSDVLEALLQNDTAKQAIVDALTAEMFDIDGLLASDTDGSLRRELAELMDKTVVDRLLSAHPDAKTALLELAKSATMRARVLENYNAMTGLKNYFLKPEHDAQVNGFVHNETVEQELYESQLVHKFIQTNVEVLTALNKVLTAQGTVDPTKVSEAKWEQWLESLHVDIDAEFVSTHRTELFGRELTDLELADLVNGKTAYQMVCDGTVNLAKIVEIYNREHSTTPITVKSMIDAGFFTNQDIADLMHDNWTQLMQTEGLIEVILEAVEIPLILQYFPIEELVNEALGGYANMWVLGLLTEKEILDLVGYDALLQSLLPEKADAILNIVGYEALAAYLDFDAVFDTLGGYETVLSWYTMPQLVEIVKKIPAKNLISLLRGLEFDKKALLSRTVSELRPLLSSRTDAAKTFLKATVNSILNMLEDQIPLIELNERDIFKYGTFDLNGFVTELLLCLPDIEEFLAMDDANRTLFELTLTAHIGGKTVAQTTQTLTLGVVVELTGDLAPLQTLVSEYEDLFDITITEATGGEALDVVVDIVAPEKLSKLYMKAFESEKLPAEAKQKLLELPTMTVSDLVDWLEGLSPEQIKEWADALEEYLPDGLMDKVPDRVTELTSEEKLVLIRDKALTVLKKAEGVAADRTIAELYGEEGVFTYTREPIDLYEKLARLISDPALLEKIYLFFDNNMLLNIRGTVNVKLEGLHELTVTDESGALHSYLLPTGFALKHLNTYGGLSLDILNGTTMPDEDAMLYWLYLYDGYENGEYGNLIQKIPYWKGQFSESLLPALPPLAEDYTEGKWILSGATDADESIVNAYPTYQELYYVEFYVDTNNDGEWELHKKVEYIKGTVTLLQAPGAVPARAHYSADWNEYESLLNTQKTVKVYADYTATDYTITYTIDGVTHTATYTVEDGYADLTLPELPVKKGYNAPRLVWMDGDVAKPWSEYDFTRGGDISVFADYGDPIRYKATFMLNGEVVGTPTFTVFDIENGSFLDPTKLPAIPDKPHYEKPTWTYTLGYDNIVIEASYTPIQYKITYIVDGAVHTHSGDVMYTVETKSGSLTIPAVPQKTGYTGEWVWMDGDVAKPWSEYDFTRGGEVRILALYSKINYTAEFKVDGEIVDTVTFTVDDVSAGKLPRIPDVPAKKGYTGAWESYTLSCKSFAVEAKYTAITYTATFIADGQVVGTVNFTVEDDSIQEPPVPEKAGYTGAWEAYELNAENLEIHAVYTAIGGEQAPGTSTDTEESGQTTPDGEKPGGADDGGDDDDDRGGIAWIWWLILILILIIAILLTVILVMRNMNNDDDDDTPPPAPVVVPEPEPEPQPEPIVIVDDIDVETADALMSDAVALSVIETIGGARVGLRVVINVHDLEAHFASGDTVDLETLKAKKLVPAKGQRLKVLADGHLSKSLTVIADSFSVQAVKMITLTGGKVIQKK